MTLPAHMRRRDPTRPLVRRSRLTGVWMVLLCFSPWQIVVLHESHDRLDALEWANQAVGFSRAMRHDYVHGGDR